MVSKLNLILLVIFFSFSLALAQGTKTPILSLKGQNNWVNSLEFSPDGQLLASGGGDHTVELWRVSDGKLLKTMDEHTELVYCVDFNPEGTILASCSLDETIKLWDAKNGNLIRSIDGINFPISEIGFAPDGNIIAGLISESSYSLDSNNSIGFWNVKDGTLISLIGSNSEDFVSFIFNQDGKILATGDLSKKIKLWNVIDGKLLGKFTISDNELLSGFPEPITFTANSNQLYYKNENLITLLNIKDGKEIRSIQNSNFPALGGCFSISPDLSYVITCKRKDEALKFWQLSDGALLGELNTEGGWVRAIEFDATGNILATGHSDGSIYLWNISEFNIDIRKNIPKTKKENKDAIAVVIGNKEYKKKEIPFVEYAINDASLMKEYLINTLGYSPDNILYYENATQSDLYSLFGSKDNYKGKLYNYVKESKSDVFIYYSGHGAPDIESRQGYFVPVDCDPSLVALNGYSLNTFYENLSKIKYKSLTVVIDACFSGLSEKGSLLKNVSPIYVSVENPVISNENTIVFTSTGGDQVSSWYPEKKHSLFTYYFLKGLKGEANLDNNDVLNVGELKNYLIDNVPYMSRRLNNREQTPLIIGEDKITIVKY